MRLNIKPLSVNKCWQGKRYKTPEYKAYEQEVLLELPNVQGDLKGEDLELFVTFGFSNMASDIDNPVKPFLDILQKKYGFNDSQVMKLNLKKVKVEKGKEFIDWEVLSA